MPSASVIHRYLIVVFAFAVGIVMLVMQRPFVESVCALALGWLLGQLFRWEPPR